ncbi:MAG: AMP-binding protein [Flavobacteriaceae bacterium]|nr:AMP-binding protein [Flavobacteriaceae bacterium]
MFHSLFKINNHSFTEASFIECIENYLVSDELYLQDIGQFLKDWVNSEAYIKVNTSGSTGLPKEIQLNKKHMCNSALATGEYFSCKENTKALLCLSANYIAGKMMLVRAMVLGWDIHLVSPTANPLKNLTTSYDFCAMVPMQVEESLVDLHKVKKLIIGGAPISSILNKELQIVTTNCYATYGMTETITHIAVKKLNNFSGVISNESEKSHYHILPNVSISQDNRDCLVINAPKVSDETIVTNDIVKLTPNSSFEWLGRYDNVINSGGVKLFPEQIEEKLSHIIKKRFFVIGVPDDKLGEKLILIIESYVRLSLSKSDYKKCMLTKYEIPKQVFELPKFIETASGKIQRKQTLALL